MSLQYSTALRTAQVAQIEAQLNGASVTAWVAGTAYAANAYVSANGAVYKANAAGTSASTGSGPSGTGASITDGANGLTWAYQAPVLKIFSGAQPGNVAASDPAGLLCEITLPANSMTSSGGSTTIAGTWQANATAAGTAASWRAYDGAGNCHVQGNVTTDLVLNNTNIASGQAISVTSFSISAANA